MSGIEFFAATALAGSFAGGAKALGVTASAMSRRVAALEDELGVQLFARTTRTLRLTDDGAAFYERCARILDEVREARDALARVAAAPAGLLRVEAPVALGRVVVAPALPQFLARYRDVRLDLTLRDQLVDPIVEGVDVLVRVGRLEDSNLIAKKLGESRIVHCASPAYLRRHGTPRAPEDLAGHACLGYLREGRPLPFLFTRGDQPSRAAEIAGPFNANDADVLLTLARNDHGIVALFDFMVAEAVARGELVYVLDEYSSNARPIHALYPPNRHLLPKVRAFIDFLTTLFARKRIARRDNGPEVDRTARGALPSKERSKRR